MSDAIQYRLAMALMAMIVALVGYMIISAPDAMYPAPSSACEIGMLNGTYSECP